MTNKSTYQHISAQDESTVVFEYKKTKNNNSSFQAEEQLEKEFIRLLQTNGYEYANHINNEKALIDNLRIQMQKLNKIIFNDNEWKRFFNEFLGNKTENHEAKTKRLQTNDYKVNFVLDNGKIINPVIIDKNNIHNNFLQVINQYEVDGKYKNRYDVTILVNGLPLVHIELKRRGIAINEAFNQINRYKNESFFADSGLYEWIQIFVISNGTITKYFSNTTRYLHVKELNNTKVKSKTSNSFAFTNYWSDEQNHKIEDLIDFTKTFFAKHTILNILTKYCVFNCDQNLLVMRPYQIVAVEKIINKINISNNYQNKLGTIEGGGYIWHTTGSGKTLTSFKTSQLAAKLPYVDKVMFVVDRKDLDYQTMKEYDKFQKGAANSSKNTKILKQNIEAKGEDNKILITTIQKLSNFIKENPKHEIYNKHCVLIFDECHRSQFGSMHTMITKHFKKYNIFGFTGTPIFAANAKKGFTHSELIKQAKESVLTKTTEQLFGKQLHTYTIIDAINDKNVLPFKYQYYEVVKGKKQDIIDKKVNKIDVKEVFSSPKRINKIVEYILLHYDQKTYFNKNYSHNTIDNIHEVVLNKNKKENEIKTISSKKNLSGFNSMLAVASIADAKTYYLAFKEQMKNKNVKQLKIATIFSYAPNEELDDSDGIIDENNESVDQLNLSDKEFLASAINDYNQMFKTNYDVSGENFSNYYKDVSMRLKNKELDLLIVVNMFLTGFDAPTLNTLWVDKELRMHGMIQAFSRTNRILNSIKTHGNIICFRNLEKQLADAINLFANNQAKGIILLRNYEDYFNGYVNDQGHFEAGYTQIVNSLTNNFPIEKISNLSNTSKKEFINCFSKLLHLRNILLSFDEFLNNDLLSPREIQDYLSYYQDFYNELRLLQKNNEKESIIDDLVFEVELVKQNDVDIDYILNLIGNSGDYLFKDQEILSTIFRSVNASYDLRSKKQLIEEFIESLRSDKNISKIIDVVKAFKDFYNLKKDVELKTIIHDFKLNEQKTIEYMEDAFKNGEFKTIGTDFAEILPKRSLFDIDVKKKKEKIIEILDEYFKKYLFR